MSPIKELCAICKQPTLVELYPTSFNGIAGTGLSPDLNSDDYKCTSMSHHTKPMLAQCSCCKIVQIPKSLQPTNLLQIYEDVVDEDYLNNLEAKRKTFAHAYSNIRKYAFKKDSLLEIGSYCGLFLGAASRDGLRCTGIEPSNWAANYTKANLKNCKVINASFEEAVKDIDEKFDLIISWDVIEHVKDPLKMMKDVFSLLKDDGYFIFSTIAIDSLTARVMGKRWHWIMDMHLYYFSGASLEYLFKESGFKLVEEGGHRHYASIKYAFKKFCFCFPSPLAKMMMKFDCLIPNLVMPFTLGDVRYYIVSKA